MYLAMVYGAFQLFVLASLSRTVRWRTIPIALAAGLSGAGVAVLLVQLAWTRLFAGLTGQSLAGLSVTASYTLDPFIEEFGKVAPLILVLLVMRARRHLGATDMVVVGAALGSGFGLAENLLRYSHLAGSTHWSPSLGSWYAPLGLTGVVVIPGPLATLTSWMPEGATGNALLAGLSQPIGLDVHMLWSSLAGLSLGLLLRGRGSWRWLAPVPFLVAGADHAGVNLVLSGVSVPDPVVAPFKLLSALDRFYPLVAIGLATWLDVRLMTAGLADEPSLRLASERRAGAGATAVLNGLGRPGSLPALWSFVLDRRAFAIARATGPLEPALEEERSRLASLVAAIDQGRTTTPAWLERLRPRLTLGTALYALLVIPPLLYLVIGDFSITSGLQDLLARPIVFPAMVLLLVATMVWRGLALVQGVLLLPLIVRVGSAAVILASILGLVGTLGGVGAGVLSITRLASGVGPLQPVAPAAHMLNAITSSLLLTAVMLAMLALLMSFPPAGLALAGGGTAAAAAAAAAAANAAAEASAIAAAGAVAAAAGSTVLQMSGDGTPGNNQAQNKEFRDAVREAERELGRKLDKSEIRQVHDEISGQNFGYHEIVQIILDMFGGS
jgi:RsiW-degrading membrane proteinase PrsW (M82 family)